MSTKIIIAIDGTSASGKGFISKSISQILKFPSLDTGALYRACTLRVLEKFFYSTICSNVKEFEKIQTEFASKNIEEFFFKIPESEIVEDIKSFRDNENLYKYTRNELIRSQLISTCVPFIAKIPDVRLLMHDYQHQFAENPPAFCDVNSKDIRGCIVEGRDIGTHIFPNADLKLFITASAEVRAARRFKDYEENPDNTTTYDEVLNALRARDNQDMNREFRPLKPADDAIIIDTSNMSKEQVITYIKKIITDKFGTDFLL